MDLAVNNALFLCPLLLIFSCASPASVGEAQPISDLPEVSLEEWTSESFDLPAGFAPTLPAGKETLLFAPGFFDKSADDFWSYAFAMWLETPVEDAEQMDELFETYYDGLIRTVARATNIDVGEDPAQVEVKQVDDDHFEATVHLIDSFVTFDPLDLRFLAHRSTDADGMTVLRVQASPQSADHAIWRSLEAAAASL